MRPRVFIVLGLVFGAVGVSTAVRAGTNGNKPSQSLADAAVTIIGSSFSAESTENDASPFLPPGHGGTPPGQGGTPPGQTTPPGHGGTPPGQGDKGTPPGQEDKPPKDPPKGKKK